MANILKDYQSNIICGLGAYTYTVPTAGPIFTRARCDENPPSGLTITLAQSGSTSVSVSSPAAAATQGNITLSNQFNCAQGDVITVTIASSTAIDNQLNTVKTTVVVNAGQGQ